MRSQPLCKVGAQGERAAGNPRPLPKPNRSSSVCGPSRPVPPPQSPPRYCHPAGLALAGAPHFGLPPNQPTTSHLSSGESGVRKGRGQPNQTGNATEVLLLLLLLLPGRLQASGCLTLLGTREASAGQRRRQEGVSVTWRRPPPPHAAAAAQAFRARGPGGRVRPLRTRSSAGQAGAQAGTTLGFHAAVHLP